MRFDNTKFRSLNETISHIDQPQTAVDEYTELLESVLLALCEELELDPNALLEDFQTRGRYLQVDPKASWTDLKADLKGRKERKSKKIYGMHGRELAPSKAAYFKKHPTASRQLHDPSTAGD